METGSLDGRLELKLFFLDSNVFIDSQVRELPESELVQDFLTF